MARSTTLNATMNMKERMLAVLQGGELDRVPFVAYDGVTATNEEVWRALGDDEMGIIRWSKVHQIVHPDVRFESRPISKDGLRGIATAMFTASGHLTQERFFDPIFNSASISKHYVESPDDYLVFREYLRAVRVVPNDEGFLADLHDVGDRGFPMVEVTRTAYQQLWIVWASLFDLSMHFSDIPEIMEETVDLMNGIQRRICDTLVNALDRLPIVYMNFPDNITAPMIGPDNFRKYCVPMYREMAEKLRGTKVAIGAHMDGDLKPLWDQIGTSGIQCIDSFSPPPDNDTSVAQALSMWPGMRLMLNFPSSVHLAEPAEIYRTAREILAQGGKPGRIWIQISENIPPGRWKVSYPEIVRAIHDHGRG
jgi:hypothetical protein